MVAPLMVPLVLMVVMPERAPAAVRLRPLPLMARPVESMLTAPLPPPRLTAPVEVPVLMLVVLLALVLMLVAPEMVAPPVPWMRPVPLLRPTEVMAPALVTLKLVEVMRLV